MSIALNLSHLTYLLEIESNLDEEVDDYTKEDTAQEDVSLYLVQLVCFRFIIDA